jgi:kynurenine/2-aminoadipate aminotransferase
MLIEEGDNVLVDNPTYSGALAYLKPLNANLIGISSDGNGLIPSQLSAALASLPKSGPKKPRVCVIIIIAMPSFTKCATSMTISSFGAGLNEWVA